MARQIAEHFNDYTEYLQFNLRLYKILEGQIKKEVEDSLKREIISMGALRRAMERIPPINVLRKATDKLSQVYIESPLRLCDNETDLDVMHNIARHGKLDRVMEQANRFYNSQKMFAIEPYIENGRHAFRVLGGHQFLPFSDDPVNPTRITAFIKLLGDEVGRTAIPYDQQGRKISEEDEVRRVHILAVYTDTEFMIIDSSGTVRMDKMEEMGFTSTVNMFGRIPYVVGKQSPLELIPFPNQEGFDISILIPKLLTDLNFAAQFMSHSIIVARNTDISGAELNPDTVVNLGDGGPDGQIPDLFTIKPEVDIDKILTMTEYQLESHFDSIGIKTSMKGSLSSDGTAGVSKALDQADITSEKKRQMDYFKNVERELWSLMSTMQTVWSQAGMLNDELRTFSDGFADSFRIKYAEMKPLKSDRQKLEEIGLWRAQKLMTKRQALRQLFPDYTEEQIDSWLEELEEEEQESLEKMLDFGPSAVMSDREPGTGQFNSGNQAAADQNPEANLVGREE